METGFLQYAMKLLKENYGKELEILKVQLPMHPKSGSPL